MQLDKSLNLTHADLENLGKAMVDNEAKYRLMHKYSYTYFSELDQGERYVSLGSQGVNFSAVKGAIYAPATGLTTSVLDVDSYQHIR